MDFFTRSVHRDYQNGTNDVELAADILSEGLDQPDWHLKYARNIIYLILFIAGTVFLDSFLFPHRDTMSEIDPTLRTLILFIIIGIACICGFFDNILDQESTEVRWFNYARFWFVLLTFGSLTVYIAMMAIGTIASF